MKIFGGSCSRYLCVCMRALGTLRASDENERVAHRAMTIGHVAISNRCYRNSEANKDFYCSVYIVPKKKVNVGKNMVKLVVN